MKSKILGICALCVLAIVNPLHSLDSFGNFFSISSQPLNPNQAAKFDLDLSERHMFLSEDRTTIILERQGQYAITYFATGSLSTPGGGSQLVGPWSIGLFRNGGIVIGSLAGTTTGTDKEDRLGALTVAGQVIINGSVGDQLQIRNTASKPISLIGTVSGGPNQNTSITINVIQIE